MLVQKRREQLKAYEKQEKRIKEMKSSGATKKQAVSVITFRPGLVVAQDFNVSDTKGMTLKQNVNSFTASLHRKRSRRKR